LNVPRVESVGIDWRVLAFAALAGLLECAILAAVLAWRAARPDIMDALRHGGTPAGWARGGCCATAWWSLKWPSRSCC